MIVRDIGDESLGKYVYALQWRRKGDPPRWITSMLFVNKDDALAEAEETKKRVLHNIIVKVARLRVHEVKK